MLGGTPRPRVRTGHVLATEISPAILEYAFRDAGFRDVVIERMEAPVRLASAAQCVAFQRESFGALPQ
jgi:hypothetical protein